MDIEEQLRLIEKMVKNVKDTLAVPEVNRRYKDPFKVLVSVILSTRTREENTRKASENLFSEVSSPQDLLKLPVEEIEQLIKPAGFYRNKARILKKLAEILIEEYGGKVPDNFEDLIKLPGVGRKVANVFLNVVHNKSVIAVDTHVHRIANRLGWVKTRKPEETETELYKVIPKNYWNKLNELLVLFGRNICLPRNPKCDVCLLKRYCKYYRDNVLKLRKK